MYEFLKKRNRLDIELYEWSKSISLVNCTALAALKEKTVDSAVEDLDEISSDTTTVDGLASPDAKNVDSVTNVDSLSGDDANLDEPDAANVDSKSSQPAHDAADQNVAASTERPTAAPVIADHQTIVAQQIQNFRKGTSLLLNVHITHHGKCIHVVTFHKAQNPSLLNWSQKPEHPCVHILAKS